MQSDTQRDLEKLAKGRLEAVGYETSFVETELRHHDLCFLDACLLCRGLTFAGRQVGGTYTDQKLQICAVAVWVSSNRL